MKKRILSMVLVLCMVVGMLPTTALGFDLSAFSVFETEIETQVITPDQLTTPEQQENSEEYDTETLGDNDVSPMASIVGHAYKGQGTQYDPWLITDDTDLLLLATYVEIDGHIYADEEANFLVVPKVDGTRYNVTSEIGSDSGKFIGKFDGNNQTFHLNLTFDASTTPDLSILYNGMFGHVGGKGLVKNVNVTGTITTAANQQQTHTTLYVGGIVGYNEGTLMNSTSYVTVDTSVITERVEEDGLRSNYVYDDGTFSSIRRGTAQGTKLTYERLYFARFRKYVVSEGSGTSGDPGYVAPSSGWETPTTYYAELFSMFTSDGYDDNKPVDTYSSSTPTAGNQYQSTPSSAYYLSPLSSTSPPTPVSLATTVTPGATNVTNVSSTVPIKYISYHNATAIAGGLVGYNTGTVMNCVSDGDVIASATADMYTGNLVYSATFSNNEYFNGDDYFIKTSGEKFETTATTKVGGLIGESAGGYVINSISTGKVSGISTNSEGYTNPDSTNATSSNNIPTTLTANAYAYVGGVVGVASSSTTIENCVSNTDSITSKATAGSDTGTAKDDNGGIIGDGGTYNHSYWRSGSVAGNSGIGTDQTVKQQGWDSFVASTGSIATLSATQNSGYLFTSLTSWVNNNDNTTFYLDPITTVYASTPEYKNTFKLFDWNTNGGSDVTLIGRENIYGLVGSTYTKSEGTGQLVQGTYSSTQLANGYTEIEITPNSGYVVKEVTAYSLDVATVSSDYRNIDRDITVNTISSPSNYSIYQYLAPVHGSMILVVEFTATSTGSCGNHIHDDTWTPINLESQFATMVAGERYYMVNDIVLKDTVSIDKNVEFCTNCNTLSIEDDSKPVIYVNGATVTLYGHASTGGISGGSRGIDVSGTLIMESGVIFGNKTGVYVGTDGVFYLNGGTIDNNTVADVDMRGIMYLSGTPSVGQTSNLGVALAEGRYMQILSGLTTSAKIFVTKTNSIYNTADYNLVAKDDTGKIDVSAYAGVFSGTYSVSEYLTGNAFYRPALDAIYLSKVTAIAEDFTVRYVERADEGFTGLTETQIFYNQYGESYHKMTVTYTGDAPTVELTNRNTNNTVSSSNLVYVLEGNDVNLDSHRVKDGDFNVGVYCVYLEVTNDSTFITDYHFIGELNVVKKDLVEGQHYTVDAIPPETYTGKAIEPEPVVKLGSLVEGVWVEGKTLVKGVDYTISWKNNIQVTNDNVFAYVVIQSAANSNYSFYHEEEFTIQSETTNLEISQGLDGFTLVYGNPMEVVVMPSKASDGSTLTSTDWGSYYIRLYVVEDGVERELETTKITTGGSSGTGTATTATLTYNSSEKELEVGSHTIRVKFDPKSDTTNLGKGTKDFKITVVEKPLFAAVKTPQSKIYDGTTNFTATLDVGIDDDGITSGELVGSDKVSATVEGLVASPNVGTDYVLLSVFETSIKLEGDDARWYSLSAENIDTQYRYLEIKAKNLDSTDFEKDMTISVMKGLGTYATPEFTYTGENGDLVTVPGALTYTDELFNTYDAIVEYLKTLDVNSVMTVNYKFTVDSSVANNYSVSSFTGVLTFIVVDIKFSGIEDAIIVKEDAIYGDVNNFYYDPSKFVANAGTSTTTGAYFLTVTNELGAQVTDLSLLKVGTYNYSVSFTSYDGAYIGSFVTEGSFSVQPRPVEIEWNAVSFVYDSTEQVPNPTITNVVWVDDVYVEVTGAQVNVGDYTGVLTLSGNDRSNYTLSQQTVTFKIVPAEAKGLVTVTYDDNDKSTALSTGDTLYADVSSITPLGGTVFYHWYRDDVLMSSAVWPNYTISAADTVGTTIRCEVTFSGNTIGTISTVGMDVGDYFFTGSVTVAYEDGVLTATVTDANTDDYTILWTGVANTGNGETYTMDLADYGRTVTVTVIANHGSGYCGNFNSATSIAAGKPYTPEIVLTAGDASVAVEWDDVFHGGSALERYTLTVTDRDGNHVTGSPFVLDTTVTSYTVMNLLNNNVYTFSVSAKNAVGTTTSEYLTAVPRSNEDVDTDGEITTTTTTDEYEDEDGNIITTTVVTEINSADGSVRVTTTVTTKAPDGSTTAQSTMTYTDGTGSLVESSETYKSDADIYEIYYEIFYDEDGSTSVLNVTTGETDAIVLPVSMLQPVVDTDDSTISFITPNATVSFDNEALSTIFDYANPYSDDVLELIAEYTAPDQMPISIRERLSDAFIMDLTLKVGNVIVSDFDPGFVTITLPYTKYDTSKNVSVYHVAETGSMTRMGNAEYDSNKKSVTFTATHFSYYAVLEEANRFIDIYASDYYYDAVQWGVENGITSGSTPTTFNPHAKCTRAEAITMLWKAMGSQQSSSYMPFTDVTASDYYFDSFRWAYGAGISTGTKPTLAGPFDVCTRDQIVTFLWIANGKDIVDEELYFSDVPVGGWYTEAIRWAVSEGVTAGSSATTFSPDNVCTRAEIITFLYKCSTL